MSSLHGIPFDILTSQQDVDLNEIKNILKIVMTSDVYNYNLKASEIYKIISEIDNSNCKLLKKTI